MPGDRGIIDPWLADLEINCIMIKNFAAEKDHR
jgi:hypothetical protein